ncbi:MAG: DUF6356 family protein [Pseudomonadota bacterium]
MPRILAAFTEHPASVDESYGEHFRFALGFAGTLFLAAGAALIHALLPFAFEKTASKMVARLYVRTHNRGQ